MPPLFISFWTVGTPYDREAAALIETLEAHGLEHDVGPVPNLGDWCANCAQKPSFIRQKMRDHPGRAVVWVDADARICQPPVLFDSLDCDVAYHLKDGWELLSGTLFFGATPGAVELVGLWADACRENPGVWDQVTLSRLIERYPSRWKVQHLPGSYTAIWDAAMCRPEDVTILHTQASRKLKHRV